jgi:hypothetical protein
MNRPTLFAEKDNEVSKLKLVINLQKSPIFED